MRREKTQKLKVKLAYNSVRELADHIKNKRRLGVWNNSDSVFDRGSDYVKRWSGETEADALRKLSLGDAEAAKKIKAQGEILNEAQGGLAPRLELGVYGCVPSVPNYIRRVPTNMYRVVREPRRNPVIDIYVESSIYDGIDTDKVAEKAAIIANVITATEMEGVRVNLYSVNSVCDRYETGDVLGMVVKIKDSDAPLNLLNIAFCVCNRAMCRNIFLKWIERNCHYRMDSYGYPLKGNEAKKILGLNGILLSVRDMVDENRDTNFVTGLINDYLKTK